MFQQMNTYKTVNYFLSRPSMTILAQLAHNEEIIIYQINSTNLSYFPVADTVT